jgi:cysteinyl-tRNA synthetase
MMSIKVHNTLTSQTEEFRPEREAEVRMFVCGPTVYGPSHVGHAKTYTQFDFIARYLEVSGYKVTYLQNITDVDDKIIRRSRSRASRRRRSRPSSRSSTWRTWRRWATPASTSTRGLTTTSTRSWTRSSG